MSNEPTLTDVLNSLVTSTKSPADLLEVYYWSREEGMPEFIRGVLTLSHSSRKALMNLLKITKDKKSICTKLNADGSLTLSSFELDPVFSRRVA